MLKSRLSKNKQGAASFYVVAFSTLILVVIAASFIAIILSEITRTSNDDLAQSAYDSALAGVEDAKLAYYNYQNCVAQGVEAGSSYGEGNNLTCGNIVKIVEQGAADNNFNDCDMVARLLGREVSEEEGVIISETKKGDVENEMSQAYTCVKLATKLDDYRGTISASKPMKVVRVSLEDKEKVKDIKKVELSWFSNEYNYVLHYNHFNADGLLVFPQLQNVPAATPPMVQFSMVQSKEGGNNLDDYSTIQGNRTNYGSLFLVPSNNDARASKTNKEANKENGYIGTWGDGMNSIGSSGFVKSNNKVSKNLPYAVFCNNENNDKEFACSVTIDIPDPVGGGQRDPDSLVFVLSLPYGKPTTDFALRFCPSDGCTKIKTDTNGETVAENNSFKTEGMQIDIDSTGRANDLFRRVWTRLEPSGNQSPYPNFAIEVDKLEKNFTVPMEYGLK